VDEITDDHQSSHLPERYKAALAWADLLLAGGEAPSAELEARLRSWFAPDQIVELTYAMACFIGYSKQLIVLGLEPEGMDDVLVIPTPG
jgi:alkylhydroperoxidase family enzyme